MALICAAKSCKSHYFENENCNLVFFPFPDDEESCRSWVLRSRRHDLLSKTAEEIHLTEFLCERHFENHCLDRTDPVALKPKAKPSVFDHDVSEFTGEIDQEKTGETPVNPDIVVIPCVIMDAGVNTEVIGYDGENIKEESIDRADIERELRLIHERDYVGDTVLSESNEGIDVHQQVINDLQPSVEDTSIIVPETVIVDSIHAVDSSEWQDGSLTHLADQICRICANENMEMIPIFAEQSNQLEIVAKIRWHLPIEIKEDDKLPHKICTNCWTQINSWHDLVATCVETDTKLRKLFKVDEQFDPSTSVYCDLNSTSPEETLQPNVSTMQTVLNSTALVTQSDSQSVVPLDEISLQTTDDSMGLEITTKGSHLTNQRVPRTIEFFSETKEAQEGTNMRATLQNNISVDSLGVSDVNTTTQYTSESTPSNETQGSICSLKEVFSKSCGRIVIQTQPQSQEQDDNGHAKSVSIHLEEPLNDEVSSIKELEDKVPEEMEVTVKIEEPEVEEEEAGRGEGGDEDDEEQAQTNVDKFYCDICGFSTTRKNNVLIHIAKHHSVTGVQFTCDYCDKDFATEDLKKAHERSHIYPAKNTSAAFVCEYCGRSFRTRKTMKEHHIALHSDDRPYKCDKCDKNYGSLSSLDIHKATHSSETPFLCDLCGKTFKHVSNLRSHKRSHLDESDKNRQICLKCGKGFRSRFHLSEHMNVHDGNRPYTCEVCGKRFHKKIQLRQHGSAHSGTQPYKCPICGVRFNRRGNMTQHVKRHSQERKYTCRVCSEAFPTLGAVLNHRKKHTEQEVQRSMQQQQQQQLHLSGEDPDEAAFKCTVCGKLLAKKESLSIHMRSHTGEKLYPCPECGKRLSNKGSLTYHMRSFHTGERPYACRFCGDGFLSKEARLVHERIHTGEKPYECLVCGMAFRCSSNLAQHARVHSDARPHPCLTCGKRFQRKGALDVHMRTHTGERPYACDLCGRAFTQKNDMLKHRRTHTNEKPHRCDLCPSLFSHKRDLAKHKASKHHVEDEPAAADLPDADPDPDPDPDPDIDPDPDHDPDSDLPTQTVVITAPEALLTAFPEITVPGMEHTQTVILQRF